MDIGTDFFLMTSATLKYNSLGTMKLFNCLWVRSLEDIDDIENVSVTAVAPNGQLVQTVCRIRRLITLRFARVPDKTDRVWLLGWLRARDKVITSIYGEDIPVVLRDATGFKGDWLWNYEQARAFTIVAVESVGGTERPPSYHTWVEKLDPSGAVETDPSGQPILVMID